jgi:hypothetical protein
MTSGEPKAVIVVIVVIVVVVVVVVVVIIELSLRKINVRDAIIDISNMPPTIIPVIMMS